MALPGRRCLSCYWNLAPWLTGARCSHVCSHAQESHSPHQAGCRGREAWLWAGVLPGPSLLGAVLLGTSQSSSRGLCSRCSPSGASTEHVCSAAHGGSWAPAPAQPQVTGAHLQPGAEEQAAVPSAAALAWQVCGAGRGGPACKVGEGAQRPTGGCRHVPVHFFEFSVCLCFPSSQVLFKRWGCRAQVWSQPKAPAGSSRACAQAVLRGLGGQGGRKLPSGVGCLWSILGS